jgi:Icc protein
MLTNPSRTILHLSDTHILPTAADRLHGVDTLATLRRALARLEERGSRPDVILVSGDLANQGELESYKRLRQVLDDARQRFGVPLLPAMGNHDARGPFREGLLGEAPSDEPYYYVAWIGGLRIIVLDSTVPGAPYGQLDEPQLAWLRAELVTPAAEGSLVVLHHPPIPGPVPLINSLLLRNADALAGSIEGSDVLAVLAGHAHHPIAGAFAGVLCFAAPATAYTVDPVTSGPGFRGVEGSGFGLLHLYGRRPVVSAVMMPSEDRELYELRERSPGAYEIMDRSTKAEPEKVAL